LHPFEIPEDRVFGDHDRLVLLLQFRQLTLDGGEIPLFGRNLLVKSGHFRTEPLDPAQHHVPPDTELLQLDMVRAHLDFLWDNSRLSISCTSSTYSFLRSSTIIRASQHLKASLLRRDS